MPKSIAQMRAEAFTPGKRKMTRTKEICLEQELVGRVEQLEREREETLLQIRQPAAPDGEPGPPRRQADPRNSRVREIETELRALYDQMNEHTGILTLEIDDPGAWRQWADANPAREDSVIDAEAGYGYCNVSALLGRLGDFAVAWNGEPMSDEDWAFIATSAAPGDLKDACTIVVQMHEGVGSLAPKSLSSSATTTTESPG